MIWYDFRSSGYIVRWSETKVQNRILDLKKEKRKTIMDENVFSRTLLLFCFVFLCFCVFALDRSFIERLCFHCSLPGPLISVDSYLLSLFSTIAVSFDILNQFFIYVIQFLPRFIYKKKNYCHLSQKYIYLWDRFVERERIDLRAII